MWITLVRTILIAAAVGAAILALVRLYTGLYAASIRYSIAQAPSAPVAIVLGAGLYRDGTATPILRDRVSAAAQLYFAGKVQKLLMSGDNRFVNYNEPAAMQAYALQLGVPSADIVLDYAGRRTYDTCYRARAIFDVTDAIIITQDFHLPRALYLCNQLGVHAVGVSADLRTYRRSSLAYWNLREVIASPVAIWEVQVSHPLPVLGDPEPIFPAR
jgi:SanA protein